MADQAQTAHDKIFSLLRTFFCFPVQDSGAQMKKDTPWGIAIVTCDVFLLSKIKYKQESDNREGFYT